MGIDHIGVCPAFRTGTTSLFAKSLTDKKKDFKHFLEKKKSKKANKVLLLKVLFELNFYSTC